MVNFLNMTFFAITMLMLINGSVLLLMLLGATLFEKFGDWLIDSTLFKVGVSLFAFPAGLVVLMIVIQLFALLFVGLSGFAIEGRA